MSGELASFVNGRPTYKIDAPSRMPMEIRNSLLSRTFSRETESRALNHAPESEVLIALRRAISNSES